MPSDNREVLNEIARVVSHDAKAPIRSIETFSGFLAEDLGRELPEAAAEDLKRIRAATTRLRELLDRLAEVAMAAGAESDPASDTKNMR